MFQVYLAAPYSAKDIINVRAEELRACGIGVTSSWLNETDKPTTQLSEVAPEALQKYANQDIKDVWAANAFVLFTDPTKTIVRSGRHVEFGLALAWNMPILVVGEERENIFHYQDGVEHFATWAEVQDRLAAMATE